MIDNRQALLREWDTDLRLICHGHYDAAVHFDRLNYVLGIPIVLLTAGAGTFTFAQLSARTGGAIQLTVGLASFAAALLASLQTFMRYSERGERHRRAGALFGSLLKEIEQVTGLAPADDAAFKGWAETFRTRWDQVSLESPTVPGKIWALHYSKNKQLVPQGPRGGGGSTT